MPQVQGRNPFGEITYSLKDFGVTDLSVVLHYILQHTRTKAQKVGDDHVKFAHADMFVSDYAQEMVFLPVAQWLKRQYSGRTSK